MSQLSPTGGVLGIFCPSQNLGKVQLSSAQATTGPWGGAPNLHWGKVMEGRINGVISPPSKWGKIVGVGVVTHLLSFDWDIQDLFWDVFLMECWWWWISKQLQFCDGWKAAFDQRRRGKVGNQCVPGSGGGSCFFLVDCVDFRSFMSLGIRSSKHKKS